MRIVIEIEEERYNDVKNQVKGGIDNPLKVIIANGIPLPTVKPQPYKAESEGSNADSN